MRTKHGSPRPLIKAITSRPETVEGSQAFDRWIGIGISVDFGPEIAELIIERFLAHLDPPGFGTAVASIRPAIASRLQVVLHVEGAVLRKDPHTRPLACFIDLGECGGSRSVHLASQDLQKCKAIVDRTMTIMKIASLPDEVAELGALISARSPVDLGVEQAQALPENRWENASQNGRSKPALWAINRSAGSISAFKAAISINCAATISLVIPVSLVMSEGIEMLGC